MLLMIASACFAGCEVICPYGNSGNWDTIEDFDAVNEVLFDHMVLGRIYPDECRISRDSIKNNRFLLEPYGACMPAMISCDQPASGYWDHTMDTLLPGESVLAFREYFD